MTIRIIVAALSVSAIGAGLASTSACTELPRDDDLEQHIFGPEDHEPYFPIVEGHHAGIACNDCHAGAASFEQFRCIECHEHQEEETGASHVGVAGYLYESLACLSCHPRGEALGAGDHQLHFPIGEGAAHVDVGCGECHAGLTGGDYASNRCAECHMALPGVDLLGDHAGVGELLATPPASTSADCKRCHADSQVDRLADHGPFLIDVAAAEPPPHGEQPCLECHISSRADKPWGADFAQQTCVTCHEQPETDAVHAPIAMYVYDTASCLSCHPDGSAEGIDHQSYFPIAAPAAHDEIACADCHIQPGDNTVTGCRECHEGTEGDDILGIHPGVGEVVADVAGQTSADCKRCHAESQVDRVVDHGPFLIASGAVHFEDPCLECHTSSRAEKPWAADFTQKTCLGCHEEAETTADHAAFPGFSYDTPSCLTCHPDGQSAINVDHEPIFPLAAPAAHAEVTCGSCHINTADWGQNGCQECHAGELAQDITAQHGTVGEFSGNNPLQATSSDCKLCHADAQVDPPSQHLPFSILQGAHNREDCTDCHQATRSEKPWGIDFAVFSCSECHSQNEMNDKHSEENGYAYDFPTCLECHPDGGND